MKIFKAHLAAVLSTSLALPSSALAYAPAPPPPGGGAGAQGMSEEDKMAKAKELFGKGEQAMSAGDFATALASYEEAYNVYAPGLHLFNFNIGQAAYQLGDCAKAKTSYQRFLDLVPEHPSRGDAQQKLIEIERSGCASAPAQPEPAPIQTSGPATDDDDAPILTSKSSERQEAIERERQQKDAQKRPLLIAGAVVAGAGALAAIGGGVALGLANREANDLASLASPGPTGFPAGNYGDDEVFDSDRNSLPGYNKAAIGLFVTGGVLITTGAALIAVHILRSKKGGKPADKNASHGGPRLVGVGPAMLPKGGGAAATVRF